MTAIEKIRNVAIIAHVDHGKTTLVDAMFKGAHMFRDNQRVQERAMDSNDQERERGITILAKTTALHWSGHRFNIVDTPGHADFGGEVERVLSMVDSVLLVVDAFDGPMPQTKFVTRKALALGLRPIVVINKVDRPGARPLWAQDAVFELLIELGATDEQLDFTCVFASAKQGYAMMDINDASENMDPLFDAIVKHCPPPQGDPEAPLQMLVTLMDYNDFVGQIGIGRVVNGQMKVGDQVALVKRDGSIQNHKVTMLYGFEGLARVNLQAATAGEIVALAGIPDIRVGETIADPTNPEALPYVDIDEPTISMMFVVNNGPFAGQDGKHTQSRRIRERLMKELQHNVALRVEDTDSPDSFKVSGRGELHLAVLIETMRREGFELCVSRPEVILHTDPATGEKLEPYEDITIDVPDAYMGVVMEKLGTRKAEMQDMANELGRVRLHFKIPSRGLIGYRSEFMTDTRGEGILHSLFSHYGPFKGELPGRKNGVLISMDQSESVGYALMNLEDRGIIFIHPGTKCYEGMIVGEHARENDLVVNIAKGKKLSNMRASGSDEATRLTPPREFTLEQALEYIEDDELVEVTPNTIRMRKRILNENDRKKAERRLTN
ncbi:translational GTPase TypA [Mesoterricola sediminis]|uniref:Large ribosomal subunit assembly factor BipA n=1 Tax=Mesoterricola sediminis TaxID=2927980 RepID=A0AA48GWJ3_9BACT|nr:translational GTPase TypA [Mesoterricola sediminis]BDU75720.1 GTP-binding protein [Mesoterricola sediminis]